MVGAIVLSPTDAAGSQEALAGSARRVVVACARAPRNAAIHHCLEYLRSEHPYFEVEGSARSVVQFEGVLPEAAPCVAYAQIDLDEQVGIMADVPPEVHNSFVWLFTWHAAFTLNVAVDSGIPSVRKHMISVLASDTVRPNTAHTITITSIIFLAVRGIARRPRHRQRKACPKAASPGLFLRQLFPPAAPPPSSSSGAPKRR